MNEKIEMNTEPSLLDLLGLKESWEEFYQYKTSLVCSKREKKELEKFILSGSYLDVCEKIKSGKGLSFPKKSVISKLSSNKKRTVYTYPPEENMVLKLLTWIVLRYFDYLFSDGLFSFRPQKTAKLAIRRLQSEKELFKFHAYKLDVSNYFNSVPVDSMTEKLEECVKPKDVRLFEFLKGMLENPYVYENGRIKEEKKGIMAGTPIASFFANLYLRDLDLLYDQRIEENPENRIIYSRYSDDIIIFCKNREVLEKEAQNIKKYLSEAGLKVNPEKEEFFTPDEGWIFLGFSYRKGVIDIAPVTLKKLKAKMRRKMRALIRWGRRNGLEPERSAKAFIRVFNRKLLESPKDNELSWAYWFFPVINTTTSLEIIDHYAQQCIRTILTGKNNKSRYNARYNELKNLGYRSLVHEYYSLEQKS